MTKTLIRHCAAMLVLGASVAEAVGQSPYPLTLHDAVELALKQNPDSQIAHIQTALSQQERAETRAGLLPNVSMQTTETVSRFNLKALIGVRIPACLTASGRTRRYIPA